MATKKEITNYANALALKTALSSKGLLKPLDVNMAVFDGNNSDLHLLVSDMSDGTYRTVNNTSGVVSFDFVDKIDPALVRCFAVRELEICIGELPGVSFSNYTENAGVYTWTIIRNGITYTGVHTGNLANACAKAFKAVVDAM